MSGTVDGDGDVDGVESQLSPTTWQVPSDVPMHCTDAGAAMQQYIDTYSTVTRPNQIVLPRLRRKREGRRGGVDARTHTKYTYTYSTSRRCPRLQSVYIGDRQIEILCDIQPRGLHVGATGIIIMTTTREELDGEERSCWSLVINRWRWTAARHQHWHHQTTNPG